MLQNLKSFRHRYNATVAHSTPNLMCWVTVYKVYTAFCIDCNHIIQKYWIWLTLRLSKGIDLGPIPKMSHYVYAGIQTPKSKT